MANYDLKLDYEHPDYLIHIALVEKSFLFYFLCKKTCDLYSFTPFRKGISCSISAGQLYPWRLRLEEGLCKDLSSLSNLIEYPTGGIYSYSSFRYTEESEFIRIGRTYEDRKFLDLCFSREDPLNQVLFDYFSAVFTEPDEQHLIYSHLFQVQNIINSSFRNPYCPDSRIERLNVFSIKPSILRSTFKKLFADKGFQKYVERTPRFDLDLVPILVFFRLKTTISEACNLFTFAANNQSVFRHLYSSGFYLDPGVLINPMFTDLQNAAKVLTRIENSNRKNNSELVGKIASFLFSSRYTSHSNSYVKILYLSKRLMFPIVSHPSFCRFTHAQRTSIIQFFLYQYELINNLGYRLDNESKALLQSAFCLLLETFIANSDNSKDFLQRLSSVDDLVEKVLFPANRIEEVLAGILTPDQLAPAIASPNNFRFIFFYMYTYLLGTTKMSGSSLSLLALRRTSWFLSRINDVCMSSNDNNLKLQNTVVISDYVFEPLLTPADLRREGRFMHHCIGNYTHHLKKGTSFFFKVYPSGDGQDWSNEGITKRVGRIRYDNISALLERATLQVTPTGGNCLYSFYNSRPSGSTSRAVADFLSADYVRDLKAAGSSGRTMDFLLFASNARRYVCSNSFKTPMDEYIYNSFSSSNDPPWRPIPSVKPKKPV